QAHRSLRGRCRGHAQLSCRAVATSSGHTVRPTSEVVDLAIARGQRGLRANPELRTRATPERYDPNRGQRREPRNRVVRNPRSSQSPSAYEWQGRVSEHTGGRTTAPLITPPLCQWARALGCARPHRGLGGRPPASRYPPGTTSCCRTARYRGGDVIQPAANTTTRHRVPSNVTIAGAIITSAPGVPLRENCG